MHSKGLKMKNAIKLPVAITSTSACHDVCSPPLADSIHLIHIHARVVRSAYSFFRLLLYFFICSPYKLNFLQYSLHFPFCFFPHYSQVLSTTIPSISLQFRFGICRFQLSLFVCVDVLPIVSIIFCNETGVTKSLDSTFLIWAK